jgi:mRNA interferase RelE/StbE
MCRITTKYGVNLAYQIEFSKNVVEEDIPSIPQPYKEQIKRAIRERLAVEPVKFGKPLKYSLFGYRRLRVGDWRIIYKITGKIVRIVKIGNRRDIYNS